MRVNGHHPPPGESRGCSHCKLTGLAQPDLLAELERSRTVLRPEVGVDASHFCYPCGDFDESVKEAVRAGGYQFAVTTCLGHYRPGDDHYAIRRDGLSFVKITDVETAELGIEACLDGSYAMCSQTKISICKRLGMCHPEPRWR